MGKQTYQKFRKSQIRKFLGSFRYRKSANIVGLPVRKFYYLSANRKSAKFLQNTAQLRLKAVLKVVFVNVFYVTILKFLVRKLHKDGVRKMNIYKVPQLRKVLKSNKLFKSANRRIFELPNLFEDRSPLLICELLKHRFVMQSLHNPLLCSCGQLAVNTG
jgi:hypothetical protein